jgi:signal transduction histidine kinase
LALFLLVVAFTTAEFSWWVIFSLRHSRTEFDTLVHQLEQDRLLATHLVALEAHTSSPSSRRPDEILEEHFRDLEWSGEKVRLAPADLATIGQQIAVRPGVIESAEEEHASRVRMFVGEGAVFFLLLMVGAWLVMRAMLSEIRLQRQQANFLSAITHELKSPLASIRLYTETMQLRDQGPEKRTRYLQNIRDDVARLEILVGNLLEVARLDARDANLSPQVSDIVHDTEMVLGTFRNEMRERGVQLEVDLPEESVIACYDAGAFRTVFRNLLDNAIKYGVEPKWVGVRVRRDRGSAVLEVADNGIGIAREERKHIFQKFYRVGDELVRQTEGSGLGLYLVRALVQETGGGVSVESKGLGKGSTFRVNFPLGDQELV